MKPYYQDELVTQYHSDALTILRGLEGNSIDLLCTDPPYGIGFMGKDWDKALPDINIWKECLRVLKPGSFAFVMSIPRSDCLSRMIISLEDAGFRTNFTPIYWAYASGFPKAQNIGKAVDKRFPRQGLFTPFARHYEKQRKAKNLTHNEICEVGKFYDIYNHGGASSNWGMGANVPTLEQWEILQPLLELSLEYLPLIEREEAEREVISRQPMTIGIGGNSPRMGREKVVDLPATPQAKALDGSYGGFQPKPAVEVIIVCMKPLSEKTFVDQALKNRKGITWLDSVRIPYESEGDKFKGGQYPGLSKVKFFDKDKLNYVEKQGSNNAGRFPANLIVESNALGYNQREDNPNWRGGKFENCVVCGKEFWLRPSLKERGRKTCSLECKHKYHSEWMSGENNPNWNGGSSGEYKKGKTDKRWKEKRQAVYKRDNYTCQACGDRSGKLHAHHIIPWRLSLDDSIRNLISLCPSCHAKVEATWANVTEADYIPSAESSFSRYFELDAWYDKPQTFPFLIVPKASKSEKNKGLDMARGVGGGMKGTEDLTLLTGSGNIRDNKMKNTHPCVKPIKLMSYLITLGSRAGDVVLDPFSGSGTTALASKLLSRKCIGIETEEKYCEIAAKRCSQGVMNLNV